MTLTGFSTSSASATTFSRKSRSVTMPTAIPVESTTTSELILCLAITIAAC